MYTTSTEHTNGQSEPQNAESQTVYILSSEGSQQQHEQQQRILAGADTETGDHISTRRPDYSSSANELSETHSLLKLKTMRDKLNQKYSNVLKGRSLLVDFLAVLFGIGTWVGVNGIFIELPLLVNTAPEGWSLPSYLSVMVQIGNLGALSYTLWQRFASKKINDSYLIYVMLALGTLSLLFTAFFYSKTAIVFGADHSIALYILTIFISINACTSAVLFMPYMGRFKEMYLTMFFVGEGLSGLLPSITALIQGIGGKKECVQVNTTISGEPIYESYTPPPRFDTTTFFLCVFVMMLCSFVGYMLLDQLKSVRREYATMHVSFGNDYVYTTENKSSTEETNETVAPTASTSLSSARYWFLLILLAVVTFFSNGIFNSIQSYSTLPYGNSAYHLSTTLSVIANPVACFLAVFLPHTSIRSILILTAFGTVINVYVFITAAMSPLPPLVGTTIGTVIIIMAWTVLVGLISYIKLSISTVMRNQGGKSLVWAGGLTQIGSMLGSITGFLLVNVANCFTAANPTDC